MRFEIGPGGGFVILVGLLGLSGAVFFLGMISGREMAQSVQNQSQLASVYPMPAGASKPAAVPPVRTSSASPPQAAAAAAALPVAAAQPKAPSHAAVASAHTPGAAMPEPAHEHKAPPRPTVASVPLRSPSAPASEESDTESSPPSESSAPSNEAATGAEEGTARAPAPDGATRHHGYNIVIDAAMDRAAASRMEARLLGLGYTSHIVPSRINGQTWYRVQVGPYPTADDARSAQAQLRAAYTARYVNRSHTTGKATGAADSGSEDSGGGADSAPTD